jgi:hypothetical protein
MDYGYETYSVMVPRDTRLTLHIPDDNSGDSDDDDVKETLES